MNKLKKVVLGIGSLYLAAVLSAFNTRVVAQVSPPPENPQSGSVGLQGKISSPPPSVGATISLPRDGQGFTTLPITVSGICPNDLLVRIFKNNVFGGSVMCRNGSYSIIMDIFPGQNELVARVYDSLDQAGPDSNKVNVSFNDGRGAVPARVSLTSNFAKRGANPGEKLTWPIILSGGIAPYAISVDWGDGKPPDLISQQFPGTFNITHTYDSPGVYNIIVKASDKNTDTAFLQMVGIANGPLSQEQGAGAAGVDGQGGGVQKPTTKILWQPAAILIPFILSTFWLGKKYELKMLKKKIEKGERPF